ncbi:uncharacterized protein [Diadema antillarum]|uniref:uncharacterized protein n=1 Tax=Diadema antillarum TaxID=105358 RepID=UPI003A84522B
MTYCTVWWHLKLSSPTHMFRIGCIAMSSRQSVRRLQTLARSLNYRLPSCDKTVTPKMTSGNNSSSSDPDARRFARPDEVNYALRQDMGEDFRKHTVTISTLGMNFDMLYGEWPGVSTEGKECPVVICVHGIPGTYGAYRPIGSRIAARGYRVLAVNLPVAMVIGHSSGCMVVTSMAADPELDGVVQSVGMICGTGIIPHRMQRQCAVIPYLPYLLYRAVFLPIIGPVVLHLVSNYVFRMGFRGRTREAQVLCIHEAAILRFDLFAKDLKEMRRKQLPSLLFYCVDDTIVEAEKIPGTIETLSIAEDGIKKYDADGQPLATFHEGTVRRVVCCEKGSHRLQFTQPELTVNEIVSLLDALQKR